MERVTEPKKSIISHIMDNYPIIHSRPHFNVYPQMPNRQIQHYIKQAARKKSYVAVQLNPSSFTKDLSEIIGKLTLSNRSSHIILTPNNEQTVHLIQPQHIRHLRLAD